jgi:hypothetical protein
MKFTQILVVTLLTISSTSHAEQSVFLTCKEYLYLTAAPHGFNIPPQVERAKGAAENIMTERIRHSAKHHKLRVEDTKAIMNLTLSACRHYVQDGKGDRLLMEVIDDLINANALDRRKRKRSLLKR